MRSKLSRQSLLLRPISNQEQWIKATQDLVDCGCANIGAGHPRGESSGTRFAMHSCYNHEHIWRDRVRSANCLTCFCALPFLVFNQKFIVTKRLEAEMWACFLSKVGVDQSNHGNSYICFQFFAWRRKGASLQHCPRTTTTIRDYLKKMQSPEFQGKPFLFYVLWIVYDCSEC